jgi:hypothetical protein
MAWNARRYDFHAFADELGPEVVEDWLPWWGVDGTRLERLDKSLALGVAALLMQARGQEVEPMFLVDEDERPAEPEQTEDEQKEAMERFFSQFRGS